MHSISSRPFEESPERSKRAHMLIKGSLWFARREFWGQHSSEIARLLAVAEENLDIDWVERSQSQTTSERQLAFRRLRALRGQAGLAASY